MGKLEILLNNYMLVKTNYLMFIVRALPFGCKLEGSNGDGSAGD